MESSDRYLAAALTAADAAGEVLRTWFRQTLEVSHKAAASPIVTQADLAAERTLRQVLSEHTPEAGIEGEELGIERDDAPWRWVLDPIDGTIAFTCGKPLFTTLIALLHEGRPVLGIIDQPIVGDRWVAHAGRTTLNGAPVTTRQGSPLTEARIASTTPACFAGREDVLERLTPAVHVVSWGGDAYNYGALAAGHIDVVLEQALDPYDYAALVPVVRGAGGVITDWAGAPLTHATAPADVLACGCPRLHAEVLGLIRG